MESLCSIFTAAYVAAHVINYSPLPPKAIDPLDQCKGEVLKITGVPSGWGSVVTCPTEVKSAADQERERAMRDAVIRDPANARVSQYQQCTIKTWTCETCWHWDPVVRQNVPSECNCHEVCH